VANSCEHNNKYSVFIKGEEFRDFLRDSQFPNMDSAPDAYLIIYCAVS
jgi:hypothetical protein